MDAFYTIEQHFLERQCEKCRNPYGPNSVKPVREQGDTYVIAVSCKHCGFTATAIITVNRCEPVYKDVVAVNTRIQTTLSAKDKKKFGKMPPISDAEQFAFSEWLHLLPTAQK